MYPAPGEILKWKFEQGKYIFMCLYRPGSSCSFRQSRLALNFLCLPKINLNSWPSCLYLIRAEITVLCRCAWLRKSLLKKRKYFLRDADVLQLICCKPLFFYLLICTGILHICLCTVCIPSAQGGQKRTLDILEQMVLSHHVGAC